MPQPTDSSIKLLDFSLCDDIRSEERGKVTLVGFFGQNMLVNKIPTALPKLCFFARFTFMTEEHTLNFRVLTPTGSVLLQAKDVKLRVAKEQSIPIPQEYRHSQLIFQMAPMPLEEEGRYRVDFEFLNGPTFHAEFYVAVNPAARQEV